MKIKSSAPRGADMRDLVRQMTLTAEDEADQKILSRLHWRTVDQGLHRTLPYPSEGYAHARELERRLVHPDLRLWSGAQQPRFLLSCTRPPGGIDTIPPSLKPKDAIGWLERDGEVYAWVGINGSVHQAIPAPPAEGRGSEGS